MITKAELEKMVEEEAEKHALANTPVSFNPELIQYTEEYRHYMDRYWMKLGGFKSGASFVTGILMPEIERVENNCDTLENKAIFWMETNDRAIEHTESLQLTITTLKTEIQSLKDENKKFREALNEAKRMFLLIKVPPIEPCTTKEDYRSLWERDLRDASAGLRDITLALTQKAEE